MSNEWRPEETQIERVARWQRNVFPTGTEGKSPNPTPVVQDLSGAQAMIRGVPRAADSTRIQFAYDYITVAGDTAIRLAYVPIPNSHHFYLNGVEQRESIDWSDDGTGFISFYGPLDVQDGDLVEVRYAHLGDYEETTDLTWAGSTVAILREAPGTGGTFSPSAVSAGDLLTVNVASDSSVGAPSASGWTQALTHTFGSVRITVLYRIADGGANSCDLSIPSCYYAALMIRLSGINMDATPIQSTATGGATGSSAVAPGGLSVPDNKPVLRVWAGSNSRSGAFVTYDDGIWTEWYGSATGHPIVFTSFAEGDGDTGATATAGTGSSGDWATASIVWDGVNA